MCGIAGFIDFARSTPGETIARSARLMADALRHRGPDDGDVWVDAEAGLALGHRRLSIVDLSPAGHQPMISASGRFVMSYNGEVYNAEEIRAELVPQVHPYRGHSDTEVLLEAAERWGLAAACTRAAGMFALALWDRRERTLWLTRDRLGKKPLYWTRQGQFLLFGSELRALRAHPAFKGEIDRDATAGFVRRGYFLHPHTVYRDVFQLEPGQILKVDAEGRVAMSRYWDLATAIADARATPFRGRPDEAVSALDACLTAAVKGRLMADVPVGAFLSGGYDSSTVVALMQKVAGGTVRTFSIGFSESDYNEADNARAVARHLGTDHSELIVTPKETMDVIPRLPEIYDEPFADSSQIPTFLVSQLARRQVTVALSGDGGDELFAGYNRHAQGAAVLERLGRLPLPARRMLAQALKAVRPETWDRLFGALPERRRPRTPGDKLHKLADVLTEDPAGAYLRLTSPWGDPAGVVIGGTEIRWPLPDAALDALLPDRTERMQVLDLLSYLPGDILTKVDRASMAVSLEARNPILDHRVVGLAWSMPLDLKIREGQAKWVLRQVLYRYVPPALVDRAKSGFGIPVGAWLRGPLRDWAEDLLDARNLRDGGLLAPEPIRARWAEHLAGRRNWQHALWNVLMLEAWRRRWHGAPTL